jgi:hypothetical protein
MRALLVALLVLPIASAAFAGPDRTRHILRLPGDITTFTREQRPADGQMKFQPIQPAPAQNQTVPTLSLGPFEGRTTGHGKDQHFGIYPSSGVRVLGGSIGGTYDHGAATIMLHWPPD